MEMKKKEIVTSIVLIQISIRKYYSTSSQNTHLLSKKNIGEPSPGSGFRTDKIFL